MFNEQNYAFCANARDGIHHGSCYCCIWLLCVWTFKGNLFIFRIYIIHVCGWMWVFVFRYDLLGTTAAFCHAMQFTFHTLSHFVSLSLSLPPSAFICNHIAVHYVHRIVFQCAYQRWHHLCNMHIKSNLTLRLTQLEPIYICICVQKR